MNQSALQLEHYTLTEINIKPSEGYTPSADSPYPSFDGADFGSAVEFGKAGREGTSPDSLWGIRLTLTCQGKEVAKFPYQFTIGVAGIFDGSGLPETNRSDLVLVNGTSLLYGALRDEILRLTSRMHNGPLMLPTVQFNHLAENSATTEKSSKKKANNSAPRKMADSK